MTWLYEMLENFEGSVMLQLIIKKKKKVLLRQLSCHHLRIRPAPSYHLYLSVVNLS